MQGGGGEGRDSDKSADQESLQVLLLFTYHQEFHHDHHQCHVLPPLVLSDHLAWSPTHLVSRKVGTELLPEAKYIQL